METKKSWKLKVASVIVSLLITITCIFVYYSKLMRFFYIPTSMITVTILLVMLTYVMYLYIYTIVKKISNKKIVIPIALVILLIVSVFMVVFIKDNVNYVLRNIVLMLIYILSVVCLPIIILGRVLLINNKRKIFLVCIALILIIYIFFINFVQVMDYAQKIVMDFSSYSFNELFTLRGNSSNETISNNEGNNIDRSYLYNYAQKFDKNNYLDKYDIIKILDIADSKSALTYINYKDEQKKIDIQITNKDDQKIQELKDNLEANYYKFNYEVKDNQTLINIERYVLQQTENHEKNEDIILKGQKNNSVIKNINNIKSDDYFYVENEIISNNIGEIEYKTLDELKLLFAYDEKINNFVPVVENAEQYNFIKSYSINSNGVRIKLKNGINLKDTEYTLRINRYDNNLEISNYNSLYYYDYEPVVTQSDSIDGKILEIKFENNYKMNQLKNIEIIFN